MTSALDQITTIGFDADDTLWHSERFFRITQERFVGLLEDYGDHEIIKRGLLDVERRNLRLYGYGVKGFTLSLVETAIELTEGRIDARGISKILAWGRDMLTHSVEPLPGVRDVLQDLVDQFELVLITKGDLFDQERKVAQSGLAEFFSTVEIVSEKDAAVYQRIFGSHSASIERSVMVGNSMRSDVLPMLEAGGWAVHIPYEITWEHELADDPDDTKKMLRISSMSELPGVLRSQFSGIME